MSLSENGIGKVPVLIVFMLLAVGSVSGWWNQNWEYRKPVNVSETSGTDLESYQAKISIDTSDLVSSGKMQDSCQDLRIANSTDQRLDHWIESGCGTSSTEVWVKIPSIASGAKEKIYVYYGNKNAANGEAAVGTSSVPAYSCRKIQDEGDANGDGSYYIDPDGGSILDAFQVYCDMGTGSGGWMKLDFSNAGGEGIWAHSYSDSNDIFKSGGDEGKYFGDGNLNEDEEDWIAGCTHCSNTFDIDYSSGTHSLTESQEDLIRQKIDPGELSTTTPFAGYSSDDDGGSNSDHTAVLLDGKGGSWTVQDGWVENTNEWGWWVIDGQDSSDNIYETSSSFTSVDNSRTVPGNYVFPAKIKMIDGSGGGQAFGLKAGYMLVKETSGMFSDSKTSSSVGQTQELGLSVRTLEIDPGKSSAKLKASVEDLAGASSADVKFQYRLNGSSKWKNTSIDTVSSTGNLSFSLGGLSQDETYEWRTWINNGTSLDRGVKKYFRLPSWWNNSWKYRQPLEIVERSGQKLENHQIEIKLNTSELISNGYLQSDCDDLRFTNDKNQELNYWIEEGCNTPSTTIWLKIKTLKGGAEDHIYLYYDNPGSNNGEEPKSTFTVYDDFDDGNYNGWQTYCESSEGDGCSFTAENGYFQGQTTDANSDGDEEDTGDGSVYTRTGNLKGQVVEGELWIDDPDGGGDTALLAGVNARESDIRSGDGAGWNTLGEGYNLQIAHDTDNCYLIGDQDENGNDGDGSYHCTDDTGLKSGSDPGYPDSSWFNFSHRYFENNTSQFYFWAGSNKPSQPQIKYRPGTKPTATGNYISFGFTDEYEFRLDDIRARKYTSPQPAYTVGRKQTSSICDSRGRENRCLVTQTHEINGQTIDIDSILETTSTSKIKAITQKTRITISNRTILSGLWKGQINLSSQETRIKPGAKLRPENGNILLN